MPASRVEQRLILRVSTPRVCPAVNSVLAIGGVGGLAIGLAGREILENLFTGLIILSSSPFEVGEEVLFTPPSGPVRSRPRPASDAVLLSIRSFDCVFGKKLGAQK